MKKLGFLITAAFLWGATSWHSAHAAEGTMLERADARYSQKNYDQAPSFRRHMLPLMGRLGCNGRACHGSFQGQGGFALSLFGYDFKKDHDSLTAGEHPRVDLKNVQQSLIIEKALAKNEDEHGGGNRMAPGSWQHAMFTKWVEAGAKNDAEGDCRFDHLEIQPTQFVFDKVGQTVQLKVIAHWEDGTVEDVTPLCRYRTNDDSIAEINETGLVTALNKGDTHVVAFYDNGVAPVQVILPVTDLVGRKYPAVPTPTKIDELVVQKLRNLGIIPSDLSTDAEFLRRVTLDMTGSLPSAEEVEAFVADTSANKRSKKIDELLERPSYAAWWTTKLCDVMGNNETVMGENNFRPQQARQWYDWMEKRVAENMPYDKLVEGIVLATSRTKDQTPMQYFEEMTSYVRKNNPADFTQRETMPHFWTRTNMRTSNDKALTFSYAFLGVRLQCAECHKHPFDQWTQDDFKHFTAFFDSVTYGDSNEGRELTKKLTEQLGLKNLNGGELRRKLSDVAAKGDTIPWRELYVRTSNSNNTRRKGGNAAASGSRVITPKLLGGDEVVAKEFPDPREALMDWMRDKQNPYFARAFVNRVWASYFQVGIVDPPDDQNLANPPSNAALLSYLTETFIAKNYDMKWLHREIANSRTYQLSWKPNNTNRLDSRNFSHSYIRRLPAEIVYDAVRQASAGTKELATWNTECSSRAIGAMSSGRGNYALTAFGKPVRLTNCDCERSDEPSLLQTMYLRNDGEMLTLIERGNSWLSEVSRALSNQGSKPVDRVEASLKNAQKQVDDVSKKIEAAKKDKDFKTVKKLSTERKDLEAEVAKLEKQLAEVKQVGTQLAAMQDTSGIIKQAYLRSLSRYPSDEELTRAQKYFADSASPSEGARDLLWALLNSKEFVTNH